ncbi:sigma-70 family RNA polymerase sigma factor [Paenibacillus puerhi]|uniref:sigma-70 family RNA polymerase sigma factor n=1 Tax=Paenibacillus puerhi TaxID=2692622 RepID=UPI0013599CC2|nr:sigma-70 family RNA polymerase sigma factor [Paenibacillus puerhi]
MEHPDSDYFREMFHTHYPAVRRKLIALLKEEAIAEDLAQEVFLRLYRNPPNEPGAIGAWLQRVLTRIAYDHMRKMARETALRKKQEQAMHTTLQQQSSSEEELLQRMEHQELREWLEMLPKRDRQVLLLRYSGYSYAEIAEQMQVNPPLIGSWLQRATDRLKRQAESGSTSGT